MAVSLRTSRLAEPRRGRSWGRGRLPGAAPARARASAAADSVVLGICVALALIAVALPDPLRDRAAAELRRSVAAPLAYLQRWSEQRRAAFLSYEDRVTTRATLARDSQDVSALRVENARLRQLLGLGARLRWGFVVGEAVPNQQAGELGSAQTLQQFDVTVGERAGVTRFTPVVAPEGLVGMVQQVDAIGSKAISYAHPDFRVSAQAGDSAYGIVQPHLGSVTEQGMLELRGVPFRNPLKPGQPVVSSGLGGTYPAGIPIGSVVRELQTPEKWARTYLLQPAVSLAEVGPVMLLLRPRSDQGLDSVWTSVRGADVASRRVAAAGDSLAREELLREAAARRAALDSTRRDSTGGDSTAALGRRDSTARSDSATRVPDDLPPTAAIRPPAATTPAPSRPAGAAPGSRAAIPRPDAGSRAAPPRDTSVRSDTTRRRPPRPTVPAAGAAPVPARPAGVVAPRPRATPRSTGPATRTNTGEAPPRLPR